MNVRCLSILRRFNVTKVRQDLCKQVVSSPDIPVKTRGILQNMGILDKWRQNSSYTNATTDILESPEGA